MTELSTLVRYVEDYLDLTRDSRSWSERDRDYYDGYQLTSEELAALQARKQPPVIFNRIKPKVDSLLGFERSQRTDPRAYPRTPQHDADAEGVTDALRYVCDDQRFQQKRSAVAENLFIEGTGGVMISVKQSRDGIDVSLTEIPWDRIVYDPHSTRRDFSDAKYKGLMLWLDEDDAKQMFPGKDKEIEEALTGQYDSDTFDDKPKTAWADTKRKRLRICHLYWRENGKEMTAIFTKGKFLRDPAPSPFLDEEGEPMCPIEITSAYVDRENRRYGVVRQHIHPQDEINKRRSKSLHLLNVNRVILDRGAVEDVNKLRAEAAKPDGVIEKTPDMYLEILPGGEMAQGQFQLLQEAKAEIDNVGVSPQLGGKSGDNKSGRAIEALQQAGLNELAVVFDSLREWSLATYRQIWLRIRQYWTEERWVRVTDDEENVKWVGLNKQSIDPMTGMPTVENGIAELDVDILVEDAPDSVNLQSEQFELLVQMYQANPEAIPMDMIIEASTLRNKRRILEKLKGDPQAAQAQQQMQQEAAEVGKAQAVAEVEKTQSETAKNMASVDQMTQDAQRENAQVLIDAELGARQPVVSSY